MRARSGGSCSITQLQYLQVNLIRVRSRLEDTGSRSVVHFPRLSYQAANHSCCFKDHHDAPATEFVEVPTRKPVMPSILLHAATVVL